VLGINVAAVYLGLSLGPFIGGILTQHLGWRSIFWSCIPIGLITILLVFFKLKENTSKTPGRIDLLGSGFYSLALIALVYGSSNLTKFYGWPLLTAGILFFILFVYRSLRTEDPVFNIALFTGNRLFAFSNIAALINYSATYSLVFLMSLYLQKIKGMTSQAAGTILIAQPLMMTILSPVAGRLSDRVEPRFLATSGMLLSAVGLLLFIFLDEQTSIYFIIPVLTLLGIGFGLFSSPNMNTIMSSVDKKQLGIASGTSATMRVIGQMTSMTIATLIFSFYFNGTQLSHVQNHKFISSVHLAFIISGLICLAGIYFSSSRGNLREQSA
jgi:MFS family permease